MIEILSNRVKYLVREERILYVESRRNGSMMKTLHHEFPNRMNLLNWEEVLPKTRFVRTHESVIVNVEWVSELQKDRVILRDGSSCLVSRRCRRKLRYALSERDKMDTEFPEAVEKKAVNTEKT